MPTIKLIDDDGVCGSCADIAVVADETSTILYAVSVFIDPHCPANFRVDLHMVNSCSDSITFNYSYEFFEYDGSTSTWVSVGTSDTLTRTLTPGDNYFTDDRNSDGSGWGPWGFDSNGVVWYTNTIIHFTCEDTSTYTVDFTELYAFEGCGISCFTTTGCG